MLNFGPSLCACRDILGSVVFVHIENEDREIVGIMWVRVEMVYIRVSHLIRHFQDIKEKEE